MTNGAGKVYRAACDLWIEDHENSPSMRLVIKLPALHDKSALRALLGPANRKNLLHLLRRSPSNEENEPWDSEISMVGFRSPCYSSPRLRLCTAAREKYRI